MQEIEGSALFLFLYFSADVFLDRIKKGDLLLRWTFQPRNICMDHLCMDGRNTLGKFLLPLLGIWKMNDHFYIDPPYQVIKLDAYRRKGSHTMK